MSNMMIRWCLTTSAYYHSLETKEPNYLYFLDDTKEIYRGDTEYTNSVEFYDELPDFAAKGKIYASSKNMEAKVWNGTEWKTLIPAISEVLTDVDVCTGLVTGEAIKNYVGLKIKDIIGDISDSNTDKVITTRDIKVMGQTLGSYKDGDVIPAGETLSNILAKQFAKQIPPSYSSPSYSISPGNQTVESGTRVNPTISGSFTQRDAGAISGYKLDRSYNGTSENLITAATIQVHSQESIMVMDGGNLRFTGETSYAEGVIKEDNLGVPYPNGHITAGRITSSCTYTGQRKMFYSSDKLTTSVTNSSEVRSLSGSTMNPSNGTKITISVLTGSTRVTIAYPANLRDITSIVSSALNLDVKGTFVKELIDVEGANGYNEMQYKVFSYIPAIPFASTDTYTVTI